MANNDGNILDGSEWDLTKSHLETAVPAFAVAPDIGVTQTIQIETLDEFKARMGSFDASQTLHVAVRSFFDNGGAFCYLVPTSQWVTEIPKLETVTLLVAAGQDILHPVSQLCQPGAGLFAFFDGPQGSLADKDLAHYPLTSHAAVFYPWLSAEWAETPIPPSAVIAALYNRTDKQRGVWSAPNNIPLQGGLRPLRSITDKQQTQFLPINMIRDFPHHGTRVWGANTLDTSSFDFRYIPPRRLVDSIERDIRSFLCTVLSEPNTVVLWEKIRVAFKNYLHKIWMDGGLSGNKPESSYFVSIGEGHSMTKEEIDRGLLRVKIGIAVLRSEEFIILVFSQCQV